MIDTHATWHALLDSREAQALNGLLADDGRILDFKVMVRPLKAVHALHQAMGRMLQQQAPAAPGGSP